MISRRSYASRSETNFQNSPFLQHPASQKVNWKFLVHGDPTRVANYEHYFLSFYMIDVDMAIAIVLFLSVGPFVLSVITSQPVPHYSWERHALLVIVALVFALDAFLLRKEIKDYMDENNQF